MSHNSKEPESEVFEPPLTQGYLDLIRTAWRRKLLLVLGIVAFVGLAYLYYTWRKPVYESDAQVLVTIKRPSGLPVSAGDPELAYFQDYLLAHEVLIESPFLIRQAVEQGKLRSLGSYADEQQAVEEIGEKLSVSRDSMDSTNRNSAVFTLSYRAPTPHESRAVLNAVIDSYTEFLTSTNRHDSDNIRDLFVEWRDEIEKQLGQKREAYRNLRDATPASIWKGKDGVSLSQQRLGAMITERLDQLVRRRQIQGQLAALEAAKAEGVSYQVLLEMIAKDYPGSADTLTRREKLFEYLVEEQALLQQYGPRHPSVMDVRERIRLTRGSFDDPQLQEGELSFRELVESHVQSLKHELEVTEGLEQSLGDLIDEEMARAKKSDDQSEDMEQIRSDIASIQALYQEIIKQVQATDVLKESSVYHAQVISPPSLGLKVAPRLLLLMPVAVLLGLVSGSFLAGLVEISDKSFRTPEEVRQRLGLRVVGHVPFCKRAKRGSRKKGARGAKVDPTLCTYFQPTSPEAEAYRGIRTALYNHVRGTGQKTIQITSPDVGDGKSTVASNLAVSMAQSGKRVVLIDGDFRRPRLGRLFGLSAKVGLSAVLANEAELADVLQTSGVPGLDVLPCGSTPPDGTELLSGARFKEVLDHMREQYDFVLIDTPPLLVVADPCVVAQHVDGILLTLRNSRNGRPQAERAKEVLGSLETNVLGVVVNNMDHRNGSNGFGYYRYPDPYSHSDGRQT